VNFPVNYDLLLGYYQLPAVWSIHAKPYRAKKLTVHRLLVGWGLGASVASKT